MRCIDADALIKAVDANPFTTESVKSYIRVSVAKMPTIEPERKTGKWKVTYLNHEAMGERQSIFYCSECNQCIAYPVNFCPNCGARMGAEWWKM